MKLSMHAYTSMWHATPFIAMCHVCLVPVCYWMKLHLKTGISEFQLHMASFSAAHCFFGAPL